MLKKNNNISYEKITDYWKDTGTPEDILHANGEIIKKHPEFLSKQLNDDKIENLNFTGEVILGKNCTFGKNVTIRGPAIIGDDCEILDHSIIGPNVSVGDNSRISVSLIENSIIMKNCKINSNVKIKDSIIANNSEIENDDDVRKIFLLGEGSRIKL